MHSLIGYICILILGLFAGIGVYHIFGESPLGYLGIVFLITYLIAETDNNVLDALNRRHNK